MEKTGLPIRVKQCSFLPCYKPIATTGLELTITQLVEKHWVKWLSVRLRFLYKEFSIKEFLDIQLITKYRLTLNTDMAS